MNLDWRNEPATDEQMGKLRFFGCTWDEGITAGQAGDALEECAKQFPDAEADYQKSQPATEMQKEKLRFFGCTWNGDITVGKASDALGECERQFPDREAMWQLQKRKWVKIPGTFPVKEFDQLDKTSSQEVTIQKAETNAPQLIVRREGFFCGESPPATNAEQIDGKSTDQDWRNAPATEKQKEKLRAVGCKFDEGITIGIAKLLIEHYKDLQTVAPAAPENPEAGVSQSKKEWDDWIALHERLEKRQNPSGKITTEEVTIQEAARPQNQPGEMSSKADDKKPEPPTYLCYPPEPRHQDFISGLDYVVAKTNWLTEIRKIETENRRVYDIYFSAFKIWVARNDWKFVVKEPLPFPKSPLSQDSDSQEVTIQEAAKPQNTGQREGIPQAPEDFRQSYEMFCPACAGQIEVPSGKFGKMRACPNCKAEVTPVFYKKKSARYFKPARVVSDCAPSRPTILKPAEFNKDNPIEQFAKYVDGDLTRNQTCLGGHWLQFPVGPLEYVFKKTFAYLSIGLCRQMADTIESRGYCVEPDARFGSGTYEWNQTLALFKPLDGDPIQPSTAYLGAANLLRLCVLITIADGKIDLVELDVFRRAIENQPGLTLTDHKRLLVLEQLLVQELCSASKTAAKIAKSIPADKRLVIGKLLVEVAAANNFITNGERRVLYKIFKSFEIPPETLENLLTQNSPSQWPRRDLIQDDASKNDRWLWNHWRTGHPGVVIDDTTLAQKTWNFNDWKALNARWRDLHERLVARQKNYRPSPSAIGEKIQKAVAAPKDFTLDMARVYEITSETKEVVAILSVLMEDESEKPVAPAAIITLPSPETFGISGAGNAAPQPTRFNGLDAGFHPILERLLTRDSWTKNDFKMLADEFHFMPSKIHDTLNEWADEVLGDFILDGEDPVIIRHELIAKETIYG